MKLPDLNKNLLYFASDFTENRLLKKVENLPEREAETAAEKDYAGKRAEIMDEQDELLEEAPVDIWLNKLEDWSIDRAEREKIFMQGIRNKEILPDKYALDQSRIEKILTFCLYSTKNKEKFFQEIIYKMQTNEVTPTAFNKESTKLLLYFYTKNDQESIPYILDFLCVHPALAENILVSTSELYLTKITKQEFAYILKNTLKTIGKKGFFEAMRGPGLAIIINNFKVKDILPLLNEKQIIDILNNVTVKASKKQEILKRKENQKQIRKMQVNSVVNLLKEIPASGKKFFNLIIENLSNDQKIEIGKKAKDGKIKKAVTKDLPKEEKEKVNQVSEEFFFERLPHIANKLHILFGRESQVEMLEGNRIVSIKWPNERNTPEIFITPVVKDSQVTELVLSYSNAVTGFDVTKTFPSEIAETKVRKLQAEIIALKQKGAAEGKDYEKYANINPDSFEILNAEKKVAISDPKLRDLSKEKWINNFDNLQNHANYYVLGDNLGVGRLAMPALIGTIAENKTAIRFEDVLTAITKSESPSYFGNLETPNTEKFVKRFQKLMTLKKRNKLSVDQYNELQQMYEMYINSMKLIETIKNDKLIARERQEHKIIDTPVEAGSKPGEIENKIEKSVEPVLGTQYLEIAGGPEKRSDEITMAGLEEEYVEIEEELYKHNSLEAMSYHMSNTPEVQIKNAKGERETLKIYESKNGIREYNMGNFTTYVNFLMAQGREYRDQKEYYADLQYSFEDYDDETFSAGPDAQELDKYKKFEEPFDKFTNASTEAEIKAAWNDIPGHERIDNLLMKAPFAVDFKQIPLEMHEMLKKSDNEISVEMIINRFFLDQIENYTNYNSFKKEIISLPGEIDKLYQKAQKLEKGDKKDEVLKQLAEKRNRYLHLQGFANASVLLIKNLERLGQEYITAEPLSDFDKQNLTPDQARLLTDGYIYERQLEAKRQGIKLENIDFSPFPAIEKIQQEALRSGYPAHKLGELESTLIGAGAIAFSEEGVVNGAVAARIEIDEDFSVVFGFTGEGPEMGISAKVIESKDNRAYLESGIGSTGVHLGYIHQFKTESGPAFSLIGDIGVYGGTLGIGISRESREKSIAKTKEDNRKILGLENIDKLPPSEKAEKIRQALGIPEDTSDEDVLLAFDLYEDAVEKNAYTQTRALVEDGVIGVVVTYTGIPVPYVGITLNLGDTKILIPKIEESNRLMAQMVSDNEIDEDLKAQALDEMKTKTLIGETINLYEFEKGTFHITPEGEIAIAVGKTKEAALVAEEIAPFEKEVIDSRKENFKEQMGLLDIKAEFTTLEINGEQKNVIQLEVYDWRKKDIDLYSSGLDLIFDEESGNLYLPEDALYENIFATRQTFRYPYEKTEGGALAVDVIVIGTTESIEERFDSEKIARNSRQYLTKRWQDNATTKWRIDEGMNKKGRDYLYEKSEFEGEAPKKLWDYQNYTTDQMPESWETVVEQSNQMRENDSFRETDETRLTPINFDKKHIYSELEKDLHRKEGDPKLLRIDDTKAIVNKIEEIISTETDMIFLSEKEVNTLIPYIQHEYYISIWEKSKGNKEKLKKAYEKHRETILNQVIKPEFEKTAQNLGIQNVDALITEFEKRSSEGFYEMLDEIPDNFTGEQAFEYFHAINKDVLGFSGTTIRGLKTERGTLAVSTNYLEQDIDTMGIIGEPIKWRLDSDNETEKNIARILLEITNPLPSTENLETFKSPFALKLAVFPGTALKMGQEKYAKLIEFYEMSNEQQKEAIKNPDYKPALESFTTFASEVREKMIAGETEIDLGNGYTMRMKNPEISSGSYIECGNRIIMISGEQFSLEYQPKAEVKPIIVARADNSYFASSESKREAIKVGVGAAYVPSPTPTSPEQPPPRKGRDIPPAPRK